MRSKAVTLMELLMALVVLTLIILGLLNIDMFGRYQVLSSNRRAQLQNQVSFLIDHISKQILFAEGNITNPPSNLPQDAGTGICFWINNPDSIAPLLAERRVCYRHTDNQILFIPNANAALIGTSEVLLYNEYP